MIDDSWILHVPTYPDPCVSTCSVGGTGAEPRTVGSCIIIYHKHVTHYITTIIVGISRECRQTLPPHYPWSLGTGSFCSCRRISSTVNSALDLRLFLLRRPVNLRLQKSLPFVTYVSGTPPPLELRNLSSGSADFAFLVSSGIFHWTPVSTQPDVSGHRYPCTDYM